MIKPICNPANSSLQSISLSASSAARICARNLKMCEKGKLTERLTRKGGVRAHSWLIWSIKTAWLGPACPETGVTDRRNSAIPKLYWDPAVDFEMTNCGIPLGLTSNTRFSPLRAVNPLCTRVDQARFVSDRVPTLWRSVPCYHRHFYESTAV